MGKATTRPAPASAAPSLLAPPVAAVSRQEGLALVAVCAVALGLRIWNLLELAAHDPFFERPSVDARMYHEWASAIAAGDWLGDQVFLNGPLYPYLLGALYAGVGPSLWAAKLAQALLGTLTCVGTWAVARRGFEPVVALGAAAAMAACEMAIFYEGTLVVANLLLPLALAAVWMVLWARERPGALRFGLAGLVIGIGALARPNLLLFAALCAPWILGPRADAPWTRRVGWLAAYALGALLAIAPVTVRNHVVGDDFVPITYAGGLNLFLGNNPDSDGSFQVPRIFPRSVADDPWEQRAVFARYAEQYEQREMRPSEVSAFWSSQAWRYVTTHPGPWLQLMLRKVSLATNAFEPWNIRSITLTREFSAPLRLPLVGFSLLGPLALLGVWLSARRWRELVPLYAWLATVFGTMLVFFVLSRYRIPAFPVLAIFASAGVVATARALRAGRGWLLAVPLLAALLFAGLAQRSVAVEDLSVAYYNLGNRYKQLEDWPRAIESYERCLRRNPTYLSAHNNLALVYEASGETGLARISWERVRALGLARGLGRYVERAERRLRGLGPEAGDESAASRDVPEPAGAPTPPRP